MARYRRKKRSSKSSGPLAMAVKPFNQVSSMVAGKNTTLKYGITFMILVPTVMSVVYPDGYQYMINKHAEFGDKLNSWLGGWGNSAGTVGDSGLDMSQTYGDASLGDDSDFDSFWG